MYTTSYSLIYGFDKRSLLKYWTKSSYSSISSSSCSKITGSSSSSSPIPVLRFLESSPSSILWSIHYRSAICILKCFSSFSKLYFLASVTNNECRFRTECLVLNWTCHNQLQDQCHQLSWFIAAAMMTSSNGNIFRVTGPLCGEFTGLRWIPLTKASDAELWCFLWSMPELTVK